MSKTVEQMHPGLPEWLQTREQQRGFIESLEPFRKQWLKNMMYQHYYDIDIDDIEVYLFDVLIPHMLKHGYDLRKVRVKEEHMETYMNEGRYLPAFMQDFHDQKDFFKRIEQLPNGESLPWVKAHVYTVDMFLWNVMRLHSCKFQKTLRKKPEVELEADLHQFEENEKKERGNRLRKLVSELND